MQLYQALITLDGWTFVAQICNLMIQLVIFKKLLLNPVKKVIAERKAKADSQIADAQKLRTEAEAMQDYMVAHGADAERLILENKSSTTIQNIANAKQLLPEGAAVAVITNDYHLARARRLLAHAGLGDAGVPAKTPYPGQWMAVRCREYCSIMGLMFTGRW